MACLEELDDVFISLEMAIKFNTAVESGVILKEFVDNDIPLTVKDNQNNLFINANTLHTNDDFILWSQNLIMLAFGNASVTLWEAIRMKGVYNASKLGKLNKLVSEDEKLVGIAYMLRCCFAHGMTRPIWKIKHQRYKAKMEKWGKVIDLAALDEISFMYDHIGGYETIWFMKNEFQQKGIV